MICVMLWSWPSSYGVRAPGVSRSVRHSLVRMLRPFELMLNWQTELGNPGEALAALERGRARSLLDELNAAGRDLNAGRSATEREALEQREGELRTQVASLEKQLELAKTDSERE